LDRGSGPYGSGDILMGIQGHHLTVDQKQNRVEKICVAYSKSDDTLESICQAVAEIGIRTFQRWCKQSPQFQKMYQDAREDSNNAFNARLANLARESLKRRVMGYDHPEVTTEAKTVPVSGSDGKERIKEKHVKTTMKHYPASPDLIKFTLVNTDPEHFKDKKHQEIAIKPTDEKDPLEGLPTDQLIAMEQEIIELENRYLESGKKDGSGDDNIEGEENVEQGDSEGPES